MQHIHPILTMVLLLLFGELFAQTFTCMVLDEETSQPLPYANIGVIGKNIGGISYHDGTFSINVSKTLAGDSIRISYLGYRPQTFLIGDLDFEKSYQILLIPVAQELKEVTFYAEREIIRIGNHKKSSRYTGWGDYKSSRGRTRGLVIDPGECVKVKQFNFRIKQNTWDSVRFRLNILPVKDSKKQLLNQNIFITTSKSRGWVEVDMEKYNQVLCGEVIVALEWVDAWAEPNESGQISHQMLTLSLSRVGGLVYNRDYPEEPLELLEDDYTPAMYLEVYRTDR